MGADHSAYAVLGLEPNADEMAIERAYKILIKAHHPDRAGGDSKRAAELNQAYREIRYSFRMNDALALHAPRPKRSVGWSRTIWATAALMVLGGAALALSMLSPVDIGRLASVNPKLHDRSSRLSDVMERELALTAIDSAVIEAARLAATSDEMALASRSRDCFANLRKVPSIEQFDRCAAFDSAVIRLQDRDPLRDQGVFSQISVTGRLFGAAAMLSGNYMATDSRLRRIRVRAELLLAPAQD